jgi:molecular chaperone DnaK (HSP70)
VKFIEESIAAFFAYNNNKVNSDTNILVFLMGSCEFVS